MATTKIAETCGNCRFWRPSDIVGLCRRYPIGQNKGKHDWCGEFTPYPLIETIEPIVPLKVQIVHAKRGRPRKS